MILGVFLLCLTSRFGIQYLVLALLELLWKSLLSMALGITQAMSWILYGLLLGSAWLTDRFTRRRSLFGTTLSIRITNNTTSVHGLQEPNSNGGNQLGKNGIPSDWVRIRLCRTDEISELLLNNDTARTLNGMQSGEIGDWEGRELFVTTKAEIEQQVRAWLQTLEA
jgi:hypothetical protein